MRYIGLEVQKEFCQASVLGQALTNGRSSHIVGEPRIEVCPTLPTGFEKTEVSRNKKRMKGEAVRPLLT
jgi:hypothetical protein